MTYPDIYIYKSDIKRVVRDCDLGGSIKVGAFLNPRKESLPDMICYVPKQTQPILPCALPDDGVA